MSTFKCPKPYNLTRNEDLGSFEAWKHNQLYNLQSDPVFKPLIASVKKWNKVSSADPNRGLVDDTEGANRKTAAEKVITLNLMLDQIANYCPIVGRTFIVKKSTCLEDVWQVIREHYGFHSTGGHFLDISAIKHQTNERGEDLYQRLFMFMEDNLIKANSLLHHGSVLAEDEDLTPTIENIITWYWLHLLHPGLPALVKQRYGAELRNRTLASLKSEISQALASLQEELASTEESRVLRAGGNARSFKGSTTSKMCCSLCKAAGRPSSSHWLSKCTYLTPQDRKALSRCSRVTEDGDEDGDNEELQPSEEVDDGAAYLDTRAMVRRVGNMPSPVLDVLYDEKVMPLTLDSGATSNMILESFCRKMGIPIVPATQTAGQADGVSKLHTVGEAHFAVHRNGTKFKFDGLVVNQLSDDVLAGMPFLFANDIGVRPFKHLIIIQGTEKVKYDSKGRCEPMVRRSVSYLLKSPSSRSVVLPGESLTIETPVEADTNCSWVLEPRFDHTPFQWFDHREISSSTHTIDLTNTSDEPVTIPKNSHIAQIRKVNSVSILPDTNAQLITAASPIAKASSPSGSSKLHSDCISINPDKLVSPHAVKLVQDVHRMYDRVFRPDISVYNGHSGNIQCHINMGPVKPPQRKARLPHYDNAKMVHLQQYFDNLEKQGVCIKPEEAGVTAEYMNMSFLVPKPTPGTFRLVTAFREIGEYSKPQPSLMPNIEETLRVIGKWKYIISTDLKFGNCAGRIDE